jgi:eukaryotic-like serine/threonine-protein kinase
VHVADFGVASAVGLDSMTMTGMVLGTAGYLSPEQARGERATPASDRYGLAVVAWELLTGRRPFESESPTAEAAAHVNAEVPSISAAAGLPPELDRLFERALAKDPAARYASAAEFVGELRQMLEGTPATTRRLGAVEEETVVAPGPRVRRLGWLVVVLLGLLALLGGFALAAVLGGDEPRATTVVQKETITRPGTTVTTQVTTTAPATTATTATTGTTGDDAPSAGEAERLNNEAFALMNEGRYEEALPMLERAIAAVRGTGTLTEAYTSYNLAYTRLQLGRCDQVLELLERSQSLQQPRSEIARARREARARCE